MSGAARVKRLAREFAECQKDKSGIAIEQVGDALDQFVGSFPGPQGTPYEGGRFRVAITAPPRYPFEPLAMKFITKVSCAPPPPPSRSGSAAIDEPGLVPQVYHPSARMSFATFFSCIDSRCLCADISSASGYICLDILKTSWSPVFTLRTCLVSLQSLLSTPEPNDPQDAEVVYAAPDPAPSTSTTHTPAPSSRSSSVQPPQPDLESQARLAGLDWTDVQAFSDMGFPAERVVETLKFLNYRPGNRENVGEDAVISRLVG
ncbi:SPOSA6832_01707, partial [Sporobolomyces salmonicolor]